MIMCCVFLQDGETALHKAAWKGHTDIVNLLLTKNPDLIFQTDKVSEQLCNYCIQSLIDLQNHIATGST